MTEKTRGNALLRYWELLVEYLKHQTGRVVLLAILSLSSIAIKLINPQIVSFFLDSAETGTSFESLITAGGIFMGLAILGQVLQIMVTYMGENVAWTATNMLRADLALHCLKLDMSFHKQHKPGELIERVDGDVNQLAHFFSQMVIRLGSNLLLIFGVLVLLWVQNWAIGLSITLATMLGLSVLNYLNKITVPRWQATRESAAQLFGFIEQQGDIQLAGFGQFGQRIERRADIREGGLRQPPQIGAQPLCQAGVLAGGLQQLAGNLYPDGLQAGFDGGQVDE